MSGVATRIFECEGHEFVQLGAWPPEHADSTCRTCRARSVFARPALRGQPTPDRPRRFLCEGHVFDDMGGDLVIHRADCLACRPLREAELARSRQIAEASKLSPEAERITNAVGVYVPWVIGIGFLALVAWLAIADPAGLFGTVMGVLLTPLANLLCVLFNLFGSCY